MIEAVLSMNGWVCVPNMGASISGLGLKLPPEPLPFLTTARGCHSPNWNPLQAIAGHDSPALNSGGWWHCSSGAGIPLRSGAECWGRCSDQYTWSTAQNLAWGTFVKPIQLLAAMQTPNQTNKREKSWDFDKQSSCFLFFKENYHSLVFWGNSLLNSQLIACRKIAMFSNSF